VLGAVTAYRGRLYKARILVILVILQTVLVWSAFYTAIVHNYSRRYRVSTTLQAPQPQVLLSIPLFHRVVPSVSNCSGPYPGAEVGLLPPCDNIPGTKHRYTRGDKIYEYAIGWSDVRFLALARHEASG
jgi:hypothetical protein